MVNRALQRMILDSFGDEVWASVKRRAGVEVDQFSSLANYGDDVTFGLAVSASEELQRPLPELLQEFGRFWIGFALESSYGPILKQSGSSLHELLPMLDEMHTRLALSFPEFTPPSFKVLSDDGRLIRLRYDSSRTGLAPFVVGLLEGLGTMFDTSLVVTHGEPADDGHVVFEILSGASDG
ncbi:MAG: heme NO-binding domain-containing protein [Planctomycetota bacterium]